MFYPNLGVFLLRLLHISFPSQEFFFVALENFFYSFTIFFFFFFFFELFFFYDFPSVGKYFRIVT